MRRGALLALAAAAALALPAAAWGHAGLVRTSPVASGTVNSPPTRVTLAYTEPVEARFAIVSVTDAEGRQIASGLSALAAPQDRPQDRRGDR